MLTTAIVHFYVVWQTLLGYLSINASVMLGCNNTTVSSALSSQNVSYETSRCSISATHQVEIVILYTVKTKHLIRYKVMTSISNHYLIKHT